MMAGHVDCVGLNKKGSAAIEGVNLIVNQVQGRRFRVTIILQNALLMRLT